MKELFNIVLDYQGFIVIEFSKGPIKERMKALIFTFSKITADVLYFLGPLGTTPKNLNIFTLVSVQLNVRTLYSF